MAQKRKEQNKQTVTRVRSQTKKIKQELELNIASPHAESFLSDSVSDISYRSKIEPNEVKIGDRPQHMKDSINNTSIEMGSITGRSVLSEVKETERQDLKTDRFLMNKIGSQNKVQADPNDEGLSSLNIQKKFSRVPLRASCIQEYFKFDLNVDDESKNESIFSNWTSRIFL